eukprot:3622084-Alexandrium_andersonii.AAC.1
MASRSRAKKYQGRAAQMVPFLGLSALHFCALYMIMSRVSFRYGLVPSSFWQFPALRSDFGGEAPKTVCYA